MTPPERLEIAKRRDPARLRAVLAEQGVMSLPLGALRIATDAALLIASHAGGLF
ncbi:hypothetical protein [Deinococcus navajonensis]|uniref:Uncharacterized protein n=1 Tax=Deinococcus navajonensis TaxID=309884 RepID=A0ABV8XMK7_9DEIO